MACNIYDFIERIRQRPGMFVPRDDETALETIKNLLHGYETCLFQNEMKEDVCGRPFSVPEFHTWMHEKYGWPMALGFASAIKEHANCEEEAFGKFFDLVEKYRISNDKTL